MHTVPIRKDGQIVDFVDPRTLAEDDAPVAVEETPVEEPEERPRSRAINADQRKSMKELLGTPAADTPPAAHKTIATGMAVIVTVLLAVVALIAVSRQPTTAATALPTVASAPTSGPTSAAVVLAAPTVGRALVAYDAPGGAALGAISADRTITLTGTFGDTWVQIQTVDSGTVWVKKVDLPSAVLDPAALASLPDLAPPPTATPQPTAVPAPVVVARPVAPAPAALPAVCTPDRVVAIVVRGAKQIASCISLQDAQGSLPGAEVIASNADEAQQFYARVSAQSTTLAQP